MKRKTGGSARSEKQKRTKSYHCSKDQVGTGSPFSLQPNMKGVLVMCTRTRETRAVKEVLDLFNQYADQLYPDLSATELCDNEDGTENNDDDLESSIAKELAELKDTKGKKQKFTSVSTGTGCLLFIKTCREIEPAQFVHDILTDMNDKQVKKTRYLSRFLPVQQTCMANLTEIERVAKQTIHPQFNTCNDDGDITPKSFAVVARLRNCSKLDRLDVIKTFAASVGPGHKVDLDNPDLTILVDITRTICMMSVVKNFGKLRKYNLESLLGLNDTAADDKKTAAAKTADAANDDDNKDSVSTEKVTESDDTNDDRDQRSVS